MIKEQARAIWRVLASRNGRKGAAMVEYALLAALIAVVATVTLKSIGTNVSTKFSTIATTI